MSKELTKDWKSVVQAQLSKITSLQEVQASSSGVKYVSCRHGRMKIGETPVPGDNMDVIVLGAMYERTWYDRIFDAEDKAPPECFAIGEDKWQLAPHHNVPNKPADKCKGCPLAEFGTALQGKGPACKTRLRLLLMPAPTKLTEGVIASPDTELAILKVSPTSVANWDGVQTAGYLQKLAEGGKVHWQVVTNVAIAPHDKKMHEITFGQKRDIPDELMQAVFNRVEKAKEEGTLNDEWSYMDVEDNREKAHDVPF